MIPMLAPRLGNWHGYAFSPGVSVAQAVELREALEQEPFVTSPGVEVEITGHQSWAARQLDASATGATPICTRH